MRTRDLDAQEWATFFDCFSRSCLNRPVTVEAILPDDRRRTVSRHRPLTGIVVEPRDHPHAIEILAGDGASGHVAHVVRDPVRVRVGQVTNGADEVIIIDSATDATAVIDFRPDEVADMPLDLSEIRGSRTATR